MTECIFCKIIKRESPAYVVDETENLISFLDIEPINEGHVLIIPKVHADSIDKLPIEVLTEAMGTAQRMVRALRKAYGMEGYSIMQNGGKFCDFGHCHIHVFLRYENDGFGWKYPKETGEYSQQVADKIKDALEV